jgi:hypothetical protein
MIVTEKHAYALYSILNQNCLSSRDFETEAYVDFGMLKITLETAWYI